MAEYDGVVFQDFSKPLPKSDGDATATIQPETPPPDKPVAYPNPILEFKGEAATQLRQDFLIWMDQWLQELISAHNPLIDKWALEEKAYRALTPDGVNLPFEGACTDVIPAIAMAVDPIQNRLSGGVFKADPVIVVKPLRKKWADKVESIQQWIQYYQRHKLRLREVFAPHLFEFVKHGHMVFKTIYDREKYSMVTYDNKWQPVKKQITRFSGPRVLGIDINNFLFPPMYQNIQHCPIIAERQILTYNDLMIGVASGKLDKDACESLKGKETIIRDILELQREQSAEHQEVNQQKKFYFEIHEVNCQFDIDGDGLPEKLIVTYHRPTRTVLQLRYNWYFNQKYPYTLIPYTVTNDSLLGIGICEMVAPFQTTLTNWHRIATDNAFLANIRMFIARTDAKIENRPKLYGGRVFRVDEPQKDFIPFAAADIYNSTLSERQNIFGMSEKRTGVSDYLTGRESPILGSRATATSTVALIQEGTKRVEEVLENIRAGMADIIENCFSIWVQYGLDGLENVAFGDDDVATDIQEFFSSVGAENIEGALGIDLSVTDASNTKTAQQQMQLAIIQILMGYYEKLVQVGQMAIQAQQQQPQLAEMLEEIMASARAMFRDLLQKYDIRNPDIYLPDLEKLFNGAASGQTKPGDLEGLVGSITRPGGVPPAANRGPTPPAPGQPGVTPPAGSIPAPPPPGPMPSV